MTTQDFDKGVDLTAVNPITAANINSLMDNAVPHIDKSINLYTVDTALNTPDVPDPNTNGTYNKFKRYLWIRIPHASSPTTIPNVYAWNDSAANVATYLRWQSIIIDLTAFAAQIAAATATAAGATASALASNVTANSAASQAALALAAANAAQTTATNAATSATAAVATANAANGTVALGRIVQGTAGQKIRTNSGASALEYYSDANNYVKITEKQNKGVDAGGNAVGRNIRQLNTIEYDAGGNITNIAGSVITIAKTGTYRISAWAIGKESGGNGQQLFIIKNAVVGVPVIEGLSVAAPISTYVTLMLYGILQLNAGDTISLEHYFTANGVTNTQGRAANINPNAAGKEVYSCIELYKMD